MYVASSTNLTTRLKVLLVDDDPLLSDYLALQMEGLGCEVTTAQEGCEALSILRSGDIQLLVTDWHMPGMDGMELVREARATGEKESYLHIAMMTARGDAATLRAAMEAGVDDFIYKPAEPAQLELAIASARRNRRLQHRLQRRNTLLTRAHQRTREALDRVRADLDAATVLHERLLPAEEMTSGVEVRRLYRPAAMLGGDSIGIARLREGGLLFFIIDVCGHGVPAALDSFHLHHRIKGLRPTSPEMLARAIGSINREIAERNDHSYATVVCGLLRPDAEEGWIVCAGHPPPLLASGATLTPIEDAASFPAGWFPDAEFAPVRFAFEPGARLVLYSDGVTECADVTGAEFGLDGLTQTLLESTGKPLSAFVEATERQLLARRPYNRFEDDISLLVLEHAGHDVRSR